MDKKHLFDVIRRVLGRPMRQPEVNQIEAAILGQPSGPARPKKSSPTDLTASIAATALIKEFESCARLRSDGRYAAYPDPGTGADPWTIGWGTTGRDVVPGLVWTLEQCNARFERDVQRFVREVQAALAGAPTSQSQFDALVSFHYNTGAIRKATLTRLHKAGDYAGAAEEFGKWVHAAGQRLTGLVRRRADEAALYRHS